MERRLAAILAVDVVGYSKLMAEDEESTLAKLQAHRAELFDPKITDYNGRIIKLMVGTVRYRMSPLGHLQS